MRSRRARTIERREGSPPVDAIDAAVVPFFSAMIAVWTVLTGSFSMKALGGDPGGFWVLEPTYLVGATAGFLILTALVPGKLLVVSQNRRVSEYTTLFGGWLVPREPRQLRGTEDFSIGDGSWGLTSIRVLGRRRWVNRSADLDLIRLSLANLEKSSATPTGAVADR